MWSKWICGALVILALLAGAAPGYAAGKKSKPKRWVGRAAAELIAVMGPAEIERETRKGMKILTWYRYPATSGVQTEGVSFVGRAWDPGTDVDPGAIAGDPTQLTPSLIECTATVGPGGIITKVSMPGNCNVPDPTADQEEAGKPELPHGEGESADDKPDLPHAGPESGPDTSDKPPSLR